MQTFEQRAGLSNSSYTPHKGLTAEETRHHHRVPDSLQVRAATAMAATAAAARARWRCCGIRSDPLMKPDFC